MLFFFHVRGSGRGNEANPDVCSVVIAVALVFSDCNTQVHNRKDRLSTILTLLFYHSLLFSLVHFETN